MADVTLTLKANNSEHINKMRQAQKATQEVYNTAERGYKREKGILEEIDARLVSLNKARQKAFTYEDIAKFNKQIQETKLNLEEYEKAGLKANQTIKKETESKLIPSILKLGAAYFTVHNIIKAVKDTALSFYTKSQEGMDLLERKTNGVKAAFNVLRGEFINVGKDFTDSFGEKKESGAAKVLKVMNTGLKEFFNLLTGGTAKIVADKTGLTAYFKDLKTRMGDAFVAADAWTKKQQELEAAEIAMIEPRAKANFEIKKARDLVADGTGTIMERITALKEADKIEAETTNKEIEHQRKRIEIIKIINEEKKKVNQLTREDERILAEAFAKLWDLQTESYSRTFRLNNAYRTLLNQLKEENKIDRAAGSGIVVNPIGVGEDFEKQTQERIKKWAAASQKGADAMNEENKRRLAQEKKDWEDRVALVKQATAQLEKILTNLADRQYEDAQRQRELLDSKISELEQELNTEVELYKAGYASNVNAKKVELQKTKALRDQALRDENMALEKKRKMEAISQGIDIASTIMSLLKMTFKNSKTWWQAIISAGIGIGAMYSLISSAKSKIPENTILAKGGSGTDTGIITGRSHARGGERFLSQVEVERGEAWGVLSVPATQKFGKVFHHMVSSFNKGQIPVIVPAAKVDNSILVNNSGSNSRLDTLIQENRKIKEELSKGAFRDFGDRIVITRGNTVRTIRR